MVSSRKYTPEASMLGGYLPLDGTVEFYGRIRSALREEHVVVDLGAGRASWTSEDPCETRRNLRLIKPLVSKVIGVDIDPVVLTNTTTHENHVMENDRIPLPDGSADVIIADYVLEHIQDPMRFHAEVDRVLRPGGYFFARTPHKFQYEAIAARLIKNKYHTKVLAKAQPDRKPEDVFPTCFRLNTLKTVRQTFKGFHDFSYLYFSEPGYYFGNRLVFTFQSFLNKVLPRIFVANLFVFMQKQDASMAVDGCH